MGSDLLAAAGEKLSLSVLVKMLLLVLMHEMLDECLEYQIVHTCHFHLVDHCDFARPLSVT